MRSQAAGIFGNLALCAPLVLAAQWLSWLLAGAPLVGEHEAEHVLQTLTLLGPTALYAAFTGVLLFVSSMIAGWVENWFVFHRLDSAIAWNPRIVARLGASRAQRWANWWRYHISGVAANVSLGLMLGLVPVVTGLRRPAAGRAPRDAVHRPAGAPRPARWAGRCCRRAPFWWCVAGIVATGAAEHRRQLLAGLQAGGTGTRRARGRPPAHPRALLRRLRHRLPSFLWPTARE